MYPRMESLLGASDIVHKPSPQLWSFLEAVDTILVEPTQVKDLDHESFEKLKEAHEKLLEEKRKQGNWLKLIGAVVWSLVE